MSSPSQASNSVANMVQAQITEFDKNFIDNLKGNTPQIRCFDIRKQSEHGGINRQFFMYNTLASNTQQVADGNVGSPITLSVNSNSVQLGEYNDFATISAWGQYAALDDATLNTGKELAYRAAQSINLLGQNVADVANSVDSTVLNQISSGVALDLGTIRGAKQSLVYRSVQNVRGGKFCGVISPLVLGDLWNGTTVNNAAVDFWKYTEGGQDLFNDMAGSEQDEAIELPGTGIVFYQSPFVTQTANLHSSSTGYRSYIYGHQSVICTFAAVPGDTNVESADYRTIKVKLVRNLEESAFDPTGTIGNLASYRFHVGFSLPPDTTMRLRLIDSVSAYS
jgi:hypothetical protein